MEQLKVKTSNITSKTGRNVRIHVMNTLKTNLKTYFLFYILKKPIFFIFIFLHYDIVE